AVSASGTVVTGQHGEGEAKASFEATLRHFRNSSRCHAVTYYFYRINKAQIVSFTIEGVDRRVIDPANETKVTNNAFVPKGGVTLVPGGVLATAQDRAEVEAAGRKASMAAHLVRSTNEIAARTP